ncbi:cytochrome P450 82A3-like protein [Corchorus olitorius]|uniref:Cytochrome P450 82A3-like protein n=1 Tax=Corchorus olitorius TaxID=93759 RepID=A0A1R3KT73_9ROSI|nr:cytochrome P450 82A3-like protein [Corchorus olitorius]
MALYNWHHEVPLGHISRIPRRRQGQLSSKYMQREIHVWQSLVRCVHLSPVGVESIAVVFCPFGSYWLGLRRDSSESAVVSDMAELSSLWVGGFWRRAQGLVGVGFQESVKALGFGVSIRCWSEALGSGGERGRRCNSKGKRTIRKREN